MNNSGSILFEAIFLIFIISLFISLVYPILDIMSQGEYLLESDREINKVNEILVENLKTLGKLEKIKTNEIIDFNYIESKFEANESIECGVYYLNKYRIFLKKKDRGDLLWEIDYSIEDLEKENKKIQDKLYVPRQ